MKKRIITEMADPGIESEIIRQVQDYVKHCKKYGAPCTTSECIEYIAENFYEDYETIEDQFTGLITDMLHIMTAENDGYDIEKDLEPNIHEALNGRGNFRKCSICHKIIRKPDDCDFTEDEKCICAACGRTRTKRRSQGNEFMEAYKVLKANGYDVI